MPRPPPSSTLFPYTTLFRSLRHFLARFAAEENRAVTGIAGDAVAYLTKLDWPGNIRQLENAVYRAVVMRSEEHTSELQSRRDLVCRLLLEKKKNKNYVKYDS